MRLTVLGSSASYAGAGQACAGYLLESNGTRVLLDCGSGVLANLARVVDPLTLDAVVVTHEHVDHFGDLYGLQALLRYAPEGPADPMPVHMPKGLLDRIGRILSKHGRAELAAAFEVHDLVKEATMQVGRIRLTPYRVDHTDATFAIVAEADEGRLCYTSDTRAGDDVIRAARGADVLLAEATLPDRYAGAAPHMTAREAAGVASAAEAGALVLTHLWPTADRKVALAEAQEAFAGTVSIATELAAYEIAPSGAER